MTTMLEALETFHAQIPEATVLAGNITVPKEINEVLVVGMGGSAMPGDILKCYKHKDLKVYGIRDYTLPNWVSEKTALFFISYSGTTEETITALEEAVTKKLKPIVIASGQKLIELAKQHNLSFIQVPTGLQPRMALGYQTISVIKVLENSGILSQNRDIEETTVALKSAPKAEAAQIANKLKQKIPVIYASESMFCLARIWKIQINENSKTSSWWNKIPEMSHNEINGFLKTNKDYIFVFIEDVDDHPRTKKRMKIIKQILQEKDMQTIDVKTVGKNRLTRIFSCLYLGAWVSYFLALANNVDPNPVEMVENLKKKMLE
jgi:glucose/mannose-6-phosphate isomerase